MKLNEHQLAKICHQANKEYCEAMGDNSQVDWEICPEWQKESIINGIKFIIDTHCNSPRGLHHNWLKEKFKNGWEYGEIKDLEKKKHPCCVAYDDLPYEQKLKDLLFIKIVNLFNTLDNDFYDY